MGKIIQKRTKNREKWRKTAGKKGRIKEIVKKFAKYKKGAYNFRLLVI